MKKYKIAIISSRSYTNKEEMWNYLDSKIDNIEMVISGNARGADQLGQQFALERGIPCLIYPAKWYDKDGKYDRGAGFKRNNLIIKACDYVICYWDGISSGTKNSLDWAEKMKKPIKLFKFTKKENNQKENNQIENFPIEVEDAAQFDDPVDWANNV